MSRAASFTLGNAIATAAGLPWTSAISAMSWSRTSRRSAAIFSTSRAVIGTKPQLSCQASLNTSCTIRVSSSRRPKRIERIVTSGMLLTSAWALSARLGTSPTVYFQASTSLHLVSPAASVISSWYPRW